MTYIKSVCRKNERNIIRGVPKKRSRYEKVHSFVNKTDISKILYTVVVLLYLIYNMTSNLLAGASLASDVITNL